MNGYVPLYQQQQQLQPPPVSKPVLLPSSFLNLPMQPGGPVITPSAQALLRASNSVPEAQPEAVQIHNLVETWVSDCCLRLSLLDF